MCDKQEVMSPQQNFIKEFNNFCNIEEDWLRRESKNQVLN